jgi:hypothetical protein
MEGRTVRSASASKALNPAWVSSTWARSGMSAARTACRNSTMTLSGLAPVLTGSRVGPVGLTSTASGIP